MKRLTMLVAPLMTVSLLASCVHPPEPKPATTYTLTLTLNDCNVGGQSSYSKTYNEGDTIDSVTVSPNTGYVLTDDSVESSYQQYWKASTDGNYTFSNLKMDSDYTIAITATTPTPTKYTLTATCNNGKVDGNQGEYEANADVALTFTADQDYVLPTSKDDIEITGIDKSKVTYSSTTGSLTFKMPSNNVSVTVTATKPKPTKYTLTATCNNGKVTGNQGEYEANEDVALTFTANDDYVLPTSKDDIEFTGVDKSAVTYDSSTGSLSFKMPAKAVSVTVTATKPPITTYTLSLTLNNCNVGGQSTYSKTYNEGATIEPITVSPNTDYVLTDDSVSADYKSYWKASTTTSGAYTFSNLKMNGDYTIVITATKPTPTKYTLTVNCTNCTPSGNESSYEAGANVSFTITPINTYVLPEKKDVQVTGVTDYEYTIASNVATFSCTMPTESVTVTITATRIWYLDDEYIAGLTSSDIGTTQTLSVNGIDHKVRLIGINHDDLVSGGKAHTTWEFADLLSDSEGYSLATVWDWEDGASTNNKDYLNSNLRKAFDGGGSSSTTLSWYQKGSATKSTTYTGSVLSMLPADLQGVIKEVKKPVATGSEYKVNTYDAKVFPLSHREMTETTSPQQKEEGATYAFYKGSGDTDANRIKHQIKWHDEAERSYTTITDGKYNADNYAGFNSSEKEEYGGRMWLRSPNTMSVPNFSWYVSPRGEVATISVYGHAYAVAPAFCLGEKEWYNDENYINNLNESNIGDTQTLTVNGLNHTVRLIGIDHDDLVSGGKAHTTWEFVDLLSDSEGYSLATVWDWESNYDYTNSNLRKAFDGGGSSSTTLSWYQKGSATKSTTYNGSVLSMLPTGLQGAIKEVKKPVATGSEYKVDTYDAKVFPLSYREITGAASDKAKEEGTTYAFYQESGDTNANRIKHQIKWHEGAVTEPIKTTDGKHIADNYAGFNSEANSEGSHFWLRSPRSDHSSCAWNVRADGSFSRFGYGAFNFVYAVAPAFCI